MEKTEPFNRRFGSVKIGVSRISIFPVEFPYRCQYTESWSMLCCFSQSVNSCSLLVMSILFSTLSHQIIGNRYGQYNRSEQRMRNGIRGQGLSEETHLHKNSRAVNALNDDTIREVFKSRFRLVIYRVPVSESGVTKKLALPLSSSFFWTRYRSNYSLLQRYKPEPVR